RSGLFCEAADKPAPCRAGDDHIAVCCVGECAEFLLAQHPLDAAFRRDAETALERVDVERHRAVARAKPHLFVGDAHFAWSLSSVALDGDTGMARSPVASSLAI